MALSIVQTAKDQNTGAARTTAKFTLGSAPTVGNRLVVILCFATADDPVLTPSGWTLEKNYEPNTVGNAVFYRDVQSGDGTTWTLTVLTTADQNSAFMFEVTGADTTGFWNIVPAGSFTTNATTLASASVTPSVVGCLVVAAYVTDGTTATDTASTPSGWTKDGAALSTFQPGWLYHRTALTTDTTTAISLAPTGLPQGVIASIIMIIAPSTGGSGGTSPTAHNLLLMGTGI